MALTHDPRMDDLTLMEAIHTPAFYIGAMGSLRNSARRRQRLQQIAEFTPQELERIHAPIGLPLGSKTPAEIALAVMAAIVQQKTGCRPPTGSMQRHHRHQMLKLQIQLLFPAQRIAEHRHVRPVTAGQPHFGQHLRVDLNDVVVERHRLAGIAKKAKLAVDLRQRLQHHAFAQRVFRRHAQGIIDPDPLAVRYQLGKRIGLRRALAQQGVELPPQRAALRQVRLVQLLDIR